jgi:putative oxidoreductase
MDLLTERYPDQAYALLRIVGGFLFTAHGIQKLLGGFGGVDGEGGTVALFSLMGVAGLIELVAGVLVMVGLGASPAAFLASGLMASGYFMAHFPNGFWPIQNGGELAAVYAFVFLFVAAKGDGRWSVLRAIRSKQNEAKR